MGNASLFTATVDQSQFLRSAAVLQSNTGGMHMWVPFLVARSLLRAHMPTDQSPFSLSPLPSSALARRFLGGGSLMFMSVHQWRDAVPHAGWNSTAELSTTISHSQFSGCSVEGQNSSGRSHSWPSHVF